MNLKQKHSLLEENSSLRKQQNELSAQIGHLIDEIKKLVQEVKKNSDKDKLYAHFGISESKIFFGKMDIRCYY